MPEWTKIEWRRGEWRPELIRDGLQRLDTHSGEEVELERDTVLYGDDLRV